MIDRDQLLEHAKAQQATDVHICADAPILFRIGGELIPITKEKLTAEQLNNPDAEAVAGVFVVYDHHHSGVSQKLTSLQHNELLKTISSIHVHLGHHDCLEVILLKGKVKEIKKLAENIVSLKGVKLGKVNFVTTD